MMLHEKINHISFADFVVNICMGLHYKSSNQGRGVSFLLLYDDFSLANFVYLFLNNKINELFVKLDLPTVVNEGNDLLQLPW